MRWTTVHSWYDKTFELIHACLQLIEIHRGMSYTASLVEVWKITTKPLNIDWHHFQWIENNVCTRVTNCFSAHERVILVFISRVVQQRGKQIPKWHSSERRTCSSREYTHHYMFYMNINNPQMTIKRRFFHIVPVSHPLGFRAADNVAIDSWWHHNDQIIVTRSHEKWYLSR